MPDRKEWSRRRVSNEKTRPHIWRARSSDISLTPKLLADAVDSSTTLHVVPETKQAGSDFEVRPKIERRLRPRAGGHLARRSDVIIRLRSTAALAQTYLEAGDVERVDKAERTIAKRGQGAVGGIAFG